MFDDAMPEFITECVSKENLEALVNLVKPRLRQKPIVAAKGLPTPSSVKGGHQPQILVCAKPTEKTFSRTVLSQFFGVFELNENRKIEQSANQILDLLYKPTWFASISSSRIYNSGFVEQLCQKIAIENNVDQANQELMRTAVHEALCNGVVHGNLELETPSMDNIDKFSAFYTKINERLQVSKYGDRHITFRAWTAHNGIWVSVTDEGMGYVKKQTQKEIAAESSVPNGKVYSGRGLKIISGLAKEVQIGCHGRCLAMRF
ncbi:ATP-binding protein [Kiloniella antarctica]|uniref:ATP-binding protein n=1 Tax=Kiloniella antarctica TaxID=1550907 RepID=A0ABW5BMA7_9PROT